MSRHRLECGECFHIWRPREKRDYRRCPECRSDRVEEYDERDEDRAPNTHKSAIIGIIVCVGILVIGLLALAPFFICSGMMAR